MDPAVLASGGRAVDAAEATLDVDTVILSIPLGQDPVCRAPVAHVPPDTVIVDTSNYYPARDEKIDAPDGGQLESLWVAEHLSRSLCKAWNAMGSDSFAGKAQSLEGPRRIAIPVAGDAERDRSVTMALVEETGFDAFDAGTQANSGRQQSGTSAYCTDLSRDETPAALAGADANRSLLRRDLAVAAIMKRLGRATETQTPTT